MSSDVCTSYAGAGASVCHTCGLGWHCSCSRVVNRNSKALRVCVPRFCYDVFTARITFSHPAALRLEKSLVFHFKNMQKPFFDVLRSAFTCSAISVRWLRLVSMEEHYFRTKNMAVCSGSHHTAHSPHSVFVVRFEKDIASGAGLTLRAASDVRGSANTRLTSGCRADRASSPRNSFLSVKEVFQTKRYSLTATFNT